MAITTYAEGFAATLDWLRANAPTLPSETLDEYRRNLEATDCSNSGRDFQDFQANALREIEQELAARLMEA